MTEGPDPSFIPTSKAAAMDLLSEVWGDTSRLTQEQWNAIKPFLLSDEPGTLEGDAAPVEGSDEVILLLDDRLPIDASDRGHPFTSDQVVALPRNVVLDKLREFSEDFEIPLPPDLDDQGADALRALLVEISERDDVQKAWEEKRLKAALSAHFKPLFQQKTRNGLPTGEYLLDHIAVAEYLRHKYRTISFNDVLYIYDKETGIYRSNKRDLEEDIRRLVESMHIKCSITKEARDILFHVKNSNVHRSYPFNLSKDLIPVRNGCIRIDKEAGTAYIIPHSSDHRFNYRIPQDFDPDIDTRPMEEILKSWVMDDDVPALIRPVAQSICQAQFKDTLKISYIFQGSGNGGKSTAIQFMMAFLGEENTTRASLHQLGTDKFIFSKLEGRLLCSYEDLKGEELKDVGKFKDLTGGVWHGIDIKHQKPYDGMIFCSYVFACNSTPKVDKDIQADGAFWRRWSYTVFPFFYPTNFEFKTQLFTEGYFKQYLKLVVDEVLKIHLNGGRLPEVDTDMVKLKWTTKMDTVGQFMEDCMVEDTAYHNYDQDAIVAYYHHWCKVRQVDERRIAKDKRAFTSDANDHHLESTPTTVTKDGRRVSIRVYRGRFRIRDVPEIGLPEGYTLDSFDAKANEKSLMGYF